MCDVNDKVCRGVETIKALCGVAGVTWLINALKVYKINLENLYCDLTLIFIFSLLENSQKCHGACK